VVTAQLEGAIGFALSMVLRNQATLDNGRVEQRNFDDYEPTGMREMPGFEEHIVNSTVLGFRSVFREASCEGSFYRR
jgi:isoquinoline 1-oxidoreductase beta subunit